jgi:hypothetical protein
VPQPPQLFASFATSAHVPEQSIVPFGHTHCELWQTRRPAHLCAQSPQWFLSEVRSAHVAPHCVSPGALHCAAHVPSLQTGRVFGQRVPQDPQLVPLVDRSTQTLTRPKNAEHSVVPDGHEQAPAMHELPAGQRFPQALQLKLLL